MLFFFCKSSVFILTPHDPSEILLTCCSRNVLLSMLKTVVQLNIFVYFFQDSVMKVFNVERKRSKLKEESLNDLHLTVK